MVYLYRSFRRGLQHLSEHAILAVPTKFSADNDRMRHVFAFI